jgi:(R,R)-butanediol dehydrogenase/meso-butanediol dehydrogenase/diacetyl reductase
MLHHIPDGVSDDNAGLAQPLAVGLHAVDRSGLQPDDVVVVHGAGAIGSFVIAGAVAKRAAVIIAVDVDDSRLLGATELGATHTVNALQQDLGDVVRELTGGDLADVTIETSGIPEGMSRLQSVTRRGGALQLVGLPKKPVSFNAVDLTLREIDVKTTVAHVCDKDLPHALRLLEEQDLSNLLVERVVPLEDAVDGALIPLVEGKARGKLLVSTTAGSS